eukprot:CAMPEP_0206257712 /NCGR_PEP_ID=MMETSP0047_2-20121206/25502_1 /ASSEMBLY_ACC=CAM_ASM_000192 /TAXON_ID=195065 /ORGANISM="Chroomonas mesostigmatica_cf, Strain CCMP1168" /LENGTH=78 /DNA_ID=CAMNT_0053684347 /DNA_START=205 /DNA_END=441 /DNA_ORIENTATION=+
MPRKREKGAYSTAHPADHAQRGHACDSPWKPFLTPPHNAQGQKGLQGTARSAQASLSTSTLLGVFLAQPHCARDKSVA